MANNLQPVNPMPSFGGLERSLGAGLYGTNPEKTYVGKVLAEQEVQRIRELMMMEKLGRKELMELLNLLVSNGAKLQNLGDWDRYLDGKLFVWLRSFSNNQERFFDYDDLINKRGIKLTLNTVLMLDQVHNINNHNTKFITDIYLFLGNTTLALGGQAFDTLTRNRFEYQYNTPQVSPEPNKNQGFSFKF